MTDTVVDDVLDVDKKEVTGLRLRNLKTGESWDLPASAMFLGIGHTPNAEFVGDQLERDGEGYLVPGRMSGPSAGSLYLRRRCRPALSPSRNSCGNWLHGGAGSGKYLEACEK